uniref:Mu-like prophage protein gp36 n=1 Tax=Candidatus Kentrum sp. UNK TaxID=2126344 RepID=A0A451AQJ8_9GAMM|nr:MAG: Mu-like prophage protein gp36 [Candidatus Kentron sp. UNK]VFK68306.1 MAG: Mu-like prophage protein gp36 [Candidatus Kentron sp. UNK]
MAYITQAELVTRFGEEEIRQLTGNGGGIDAAVVAAAIADTDALMDGYLMARYRLPFAETPPLLLPVAANIARHFLYADQSVKPVEERYQDALKTLDKISRGSITLPGETPGSTNTVNDRVVSVHEREGIFGQNVLDRAFRR